MSETLNHKPDISKENVCPPLPSDANNIDKIVYWLGIGLGSGLPKKAPGTWGTVGGMVVAIPLLFLGFTPFLIITIIASIVGIWICGRTSELMGVHDDPHIVFDEWAGIWIAMLPLVALVEEKMPYCIATYSSFFGKGLVIFLLFRFFDILKPFPIRYIDQKLTGGLGIMLDDILAGLATLAVYLLIF